MSAPTQDDLIALAHRADGRENVVLDATRRANLRARSILSARYVACPDCAAQIERTMVGETFVLVVLHSKTCPVFAQLWNKVDRLPTSRQVDERTREVIRDDT